MGHPTSPTLLAGLPGRKSLVASDPPSACSVAAILPETRNYSRCPVENGRDLSVISLNERSWRSFAQGGQTSYFRSTEKAGLRTNHALDDSAPNRTPRPDHASSPGSRLPLSRKSKVQFLAADKPALTQATDGFRPPETFAETFAEALAGCITGRVRGTPVDCRRTVTRVLCDVYGN